jgi:glycosyltransferase involved in cell wall biosynthesis
MLTIHLITDEILPAKGGLEQWTLRLAMMLSLEANVRVIIHVITKRLPHHDELVKDSSIEFSWLDDKKTPWLEPLDGITNSAEISGLNFLCIRNAVAESATQFPDSKHLIISNYLLGTGFLAAVVAENLQIPHIACVVGTDFSRGFRNSQERLVVEKVVKSADFVVTFNNEQKLSLCSAFDLRNISTIYTSVDERSFDYHWQKRDGDTIRLFSDCGFSNKKGSQVLLNSFAELIDEGFMLSLTICGNTIWSQKSYWTNLQNNFIEKFHSKVTFHSFLEPSRIWSLISDCDFYCSATLGEGCSLARAAALCIGSPIVSTLCGELADLAADVSHVNLARTGDAQGFKDALRKSCLELLSGGPAIDQARVIEWREIFSADRELEQWRTVLRQVSP